MSDAAEFTSLVSWTQSHMRLDFIGYDGKKKTRKLDPDLLFNAEKTPL